jgi:hypothetical protein
MIIGYEVIRCTLVLQLMAGFIIPVVPEMQCARRLNTDKILSQRKDSGKKVSYRRGAET